LANKRIRRNKDFGSYIAASNQDNIDLKNRNNISEVGASVITGDNLANDVAISTTSISSSDYAEGTSGWKIDGTGTAEFSNVFVRGDINAYSGTIGYWNISTPGVERTIGGERLFGTFLESENLGDSDTDNTLGVYVGLYRSYREDAIDITSVFRRDGVATVVSANHGYQSGYLVSLNIAGTLTYDTEPIIVVSKNVTSNVATITLEIAHACQPGDSVTISGMGSPFDGSYTTLPGTIDKVIKYAVSNVDISETAVTEASSIMVQNVSETGLKFSTGASYVTVIDSDYNSFKFQSSGVNIEATRGVAFTGTATLYDDNIAGLYLQDYSKSLFDHGYFSSEGIKYVSAATYNAVHNPSFEYIDIVSEEITPSTEQWTASSGVSLSNYALLDASSSYLGSSSYGLEVSWASTTTGYVSGLVEYKVLDAYVSRDRDLYLNFDMFVNPFTRRLVPTNFQISDSKVRVTCEDHGLTTGNQIYNYSTATTPVISENKVHVVTVINSSTFDVENSAQHGSDWTSNGANNYIYLLDIPKYDVSGIQFKFPNSDVLVPISDLVTDETKAAWVAEGSNAEIITISMDNIEVDQGYYLISINSEGDDIDFYSIPKLTPTTIDTLTSKSKLAIKIDIARLYSFYRRLDAVGLSSAEAVDSNIEIQFPAWLTDQFSNKIPNHSLVLDNVYVSTEDRFFYGDSNPESNTWLNSTADVVDTASVENPKTWLSIDLNSQVAQLNYLDAVTFKSSSFNGSLFTNAGLYSTNSNYDYNEALNRATTIEDASDSVVVSTSGKYRKNLTPKTSLIYSISVQSLVNKEFLITTESPHGLNFSDTVFVYDSRNDDFNNIIYGLAIVSIPSSTEVVVHNPLASAGDDHNSAGNGEISNSSYDFIDLESYSSSRVTKSFASYQISSVLDFNDYNDTYGLSKVGVSSADVALLSDEDYSEIVLSADVLSIKNRNIEFSRNNYIDSSKTDASIKIEGSLQNTNLVPNRNFEYFIDSIVESESEPGVYTLTIDTAINDYHRLRVGNKISLETPGFDAIWVVQVSSVSSNTSVVFTETSSEFDPVDYEGGFLQLVYVSHPYVTYDLPSNIVSSYGQHYLATIDYVSNRIGSVLGGSLTDLEWIKSTTIDETTTYPLETPLYYDGSSLTLLYDATLLVDETTGELGADVDSISTTVLESITADAPLDFTAGTLSLVNGYVYNDDNVDYARLWIGASEPIDAAPGDVWIATA
jgi:hypothetical protein